jgi:hypothetical protein
MTHSLLNLLTMPEGDRFEYLAANCIFLLSYESASMKSSLFACENFFLEVQYVASGDAILNMEVFRSPERIDAYLSGIDIASVI